MYFFIHLFSWSLAGFLLPKIFCRVFERVFQLLSGDLQNYQRVLVNIETGDVSNGDRTFRDARFHIEDCRHRHIGFAGFELDSLDQIQDRSVAKTRLRRG